MLDIKILILLKSFQENNIKIDNITVDSGKSKDMFLVTFWYNKKVVDYSYEMDFSHIEHFINGMNLMYSWSWQNNHK